MKTLFRFITKSDHIRIVEIFLEESSDINSVRDGGGRALDIAAEHGRLHFVRLFQDRA